MSLCCCCCCFTFSSCGPLRKRPGFAQIRGTPVCFTMSRDPCCAVWSKEWKPQSWLCPSLSLCPWEVWAFWCLSFLSCRVGPILPAFIEASHEPRADAQLIPLSPSQPCKPGAVTKHVALYSGSLWSPHSAWMCWSSSWVTGWMLWQMRTARTVHCIHGLRWSYCGAPPQWPWTTVRHEKSHAYWD